MLRVLVTGTSSGLGRALQRAFSAAAFRRSDVEAECRHAASESWDLIVHCAADARKELPAADIGAYHESNVTLTSRLLTIPHRLFVYVSSQAVYPADGHRWREEEPLVVSDRLSVYGVFKLLAEDVVKRGTSRALVLRTASLVGPEGRPNNIMRVLRRQAGQIFLSGDSPYNLVAYSQVEAFIRESFAHDRVGTFNLGAADERTLAELASYLDVDMSFGDVLYAAPQADFTALRRETNIFNLTTFDVVDLVAAQIAAAAGTN